MAYEALLSQIPLRPAVPRTRVVSTAHQTSLVHDHLPTDDLVAYHEARARGGVGAVFLTATAVHETGPLTAHTIGGYLPAHPDTGDLRPTRSVARGRGDAAGVKGTRLLVQLFHGGQNQISSLPRSP